MNAVVLPTLTDLVTKRMLELKLSFAPYLREEAKRCLTDGGRSVNRENLDAGEFDVESRYVRNYDRSQECDAGKVSYDVCGILLETFFQEDRSIKPYLLDALGETYDAHHVRCDRKTVVPDSSGVKNSSITFLLDWKDDLGFDALVKLTVIVRRNNPSTMELHFTNKKSKLQPFLN